jgi:hypothetical protein
MVEFKLTSEVVIFAQGAPLPPISEVGVPDTEKNIEILSNDLALMVGVGILILIVLAIFAKLSYGGKNRKRKRVSGSRSVPDSSTLPRIPSPKETREERKQRRQKRSHRPSNPTLGETGGLPPERGDADSDRS